MSEETRDGDVVRVERRTALAPDVRDTYHAIYERAFGPLRTRAAARHLLTREEFDGELLAASIDKYVALSGTGQVLGLTLLSNDLGTVGWISPDYYAHRWPEHHARNAVYYLGFTLVDPAHQRAGVFEAMLDAVVRRLLEEDAVCVWDVCGFNVDGGFADAIAAMVGDRSTTAPEVVDTQRYYAADFRGATP